MVSPYYQAATWAELRAVCSKRDPTPQDFLSIVSLYYRAKTNLFTEEDAEAEGWSEMLKYSDGNRAGFNGWPCKDYAGVDGQAYDRGYQVGLRARMEALGVEPPGGKQRPARVRKLPKPDGKRPSNQ